MVWVAASQVAVVPPPHVPLARLAPHPEQVRLVVRALSPQLSAQVPCAVPQPAPPEQVTVQHWFVGPTLQVVGDVEHEQPLHTSPVPLQ